MNAIDLNPQSARALLQACPAYAPTPLKSTVIDSRRFWLKDETDRMKLGAFKALGGVYGVARLIERELDINLAALAPDSLPLEKAASMTFVCASAGNHGLAVAAGARLFGAKARIHLARPVPKEFEERLIAKGAQVARSGDDYEQSVQAAMADAEKTGAVHLADGSWRGYTEPPRVVMEGYTVLAQELREAFEREDDWPTHVYLQAGVGGLAAAIAYMIRRNWARQPRIVIVEPDAAPCLRESLRAGELTSVQGPVSAMGRLDCKTPSLLAFEILRECADDARAISDEQAVAAVARLREAGIFTTPSGAAGFAAMLEEDAPAPLIIVSEKEVS